MAFGKRGRSHLKQKTGIDLLISRIVRWPAGRHIVIAAILVAVACWSIFFERDRFIGFSVLFLAALFVGLGFNGLRRDASRMAHLERCRSLDTLKELDPYEVASLVMAMYELDGCTVRLAHGQESTEADVDLIASRGPKRIVVIRCRDWDKTMLGLEAVKRVKAAMSATDAVGGVILGLGAASADARSFAERKGIELILGGDLVARIADVLSGNTTRQSTGRTARHESDFSAGNGGRHPEVPAAQSIHRVAFIAAEAIESGYEQLEACLMPQTDFAIVACGSGQVGLDELRLRMPSLASRIVGATTPFGGGISGARFMEIQRYLREHAARNAQWFAVDTSPRLYPEGTLELVVVGDERIISAEVVRRIESAIEQIRIRGEAAVAA